VRIPDCSHDALVDDLVHMDDGAKFAVVDHTHVEHTADDRVAVAAVGRVAGDRILAENDNFVAVENEDAGGIVAAQVGVEIVAPGVQMLTEAASVALAADMDEQRLNDSP